MTVLRGEAKFEVKIRDVAEDVLPSATTHDTDAEDSVAIRGPAVTLTIEIRESAHRSLPLPAKVATTQCEGKCCKA
jgi:hypothetical protein